MLVYAKKIDGVQKLFGTELNVPSESDSQLTYVDENGSTVTVDDKSYFYNKDCKNNIQHVYVNESKNQIPSDADVQVNVKLGSKFIIGE